MANRRVLLIGWEGADWLAIDPLLRSGEMPALASLLNQGLKAQLASLEPRNDACSWTTLLTGRRPYQHGIVTDMEPDGRGATCPVTSTSRTAPAIWNLLDEHGLRSHVVGFPASYPAEQISGTMVSDRYPHTTGESSELWPTDDEAIYPQTVAEELLDLRLPPRDIVQSEIAEFVPSYAKADQHQQKLIGRLCTYVARAASTHNAATWLATQEQWDFLAVRYDLVGMLAHEFAVYPQRLPYLRDRDCDMFMSVMPAAYRLLDQMLGRLLEIAGEETTILVVSNHGFVSQANNRLKKPDTDEEQPRTRRPAYDRLDDHSMMGVLVAAGSDLPTCVESDSAESQVRYTALQLVPSILALFNLPVGSTWEGRPIQEQLSSNQSRAPAATSEDSQEPNFDGGSDVWTQQEILGQLASLGCVSLDPESFAAAEHCLRTRLLNIGLSLANHGRHEDALHYWRLLKEREPAPYAYCQLGNCLLQLGEANEATMLAEELAESLPYHPAAILLKSTCYEELGREQEALEQLTASLKLHPRSARLHQQLGRLAIKTKQLKLAAVHLEYALQLSPEDAKTHYSLSELLYYCGKEELAQKHLDLSKKYSPFIL